MDDSKIFMFPDGGTRQTSRAFRLATSEATLMNKDVEPIFV